MITDMFILSTRSISDGANACTIFLIPIRKSEQFSSAFSVQRM